MKAFTRRWVLLIGILVGLGLLRVGLVPTAQAAPAAVITLPADYYRIDVDPIATLADDSNSGAGGACTLRDALTYVNSSGGVPQGCSTTTVGTGGPPYVIMLPTGGYLYTLDAASLEQALSTLYIVGDTADNTIIQASADDPTDGGGTDHRVMINDGGTLILSNLTLRYGQCTGGCVGSQNGGGLYAVIGTVQLYDVTVMNNQVIGHEGGGIYSTITLTVTNSTISGNKVIGGEGGGIFNNNGTLTVTNSTVSGNSANDSAGGGIFNRDGPATVTSSTFFDNSAYDGGGFINFSAGGVCADSSVVTIANSTFSGNSAIGAGGGIRNQYGVITLLYNTITANPSGGGVFSYNSSDTCTKVGGNLIAGNTGYDVIATSTAQRFDSLGYNLVGVAGANVDFGLEFNATGDQTGVADPMLGSLADNGGPTLTHGLLPGSPAVDTGDTTLCAASPVSGVDQRGVTRPQGSTCDTGAYEGVLVVVSPTAVPNFDVTLTASVDPASAGVGDTVFWTFVISNPGTQDTAGLSFRADLPSNLDYVGLTTTSGALRTPMTLPTIWVDMPNIPVGGDVTIVIETTVDATVSAALPMHARVVQQAVKAAPHLLQTASACVQGSVAQVGAQACLTVLPAELPETGGQPVLPLPVFGAVLAAMLLASGGLLLRKRLASR